ncbi:MAG: DUF748 domain-containing protein [Steroidobacteraceae bacterium]|jgi:hypothetical protein|nr:DUF748 domain-containing protein [Steroidobacteraceae bacterium]
MVAQPGTPRRLPRWPVVLLATALLLLLVAMLATVLAPRLRPWIVRESNARLQGYTLALGGVALRPWSLTLELRDLVVRQDAHPDPAMLAVPRLRVDVEWRSLLRGRVVAQALVEGPAVVVDAAQLRAEAGDRVPLARRGWQRLPELYPLELNALEVRNGTLVYRAPEARRPLRLVAINGSARNIRHVEAGSGSHPSPLHLEAVVFDVGRARFDGAADFLRHARPAVKGRGSIDAVPLATLGPILRGYPLRIAGGTLAAAGAVELGPRGTRAHLEKVAIRGIRVDYLGGGDPAARQALRRAAQAARSASRDPAVWLRMDELQVDGEFGFVNEGRDRPYRLFLGDARVRVHDLDNRRTDGRATLAVSGRPMGAGRAAIRGAFRNGPGPADFALDVRTSGLPVTRLNPLLESHAGLDAAEGRFELYSQVLVEDGRIRGYVKPLFRDLELYDRDQDEDDGVLRQVYEFVADGVRRILENGRRDTVGTVADLSGPLQDPDASVLQIIGNLARNAFVEAILPGFEQRAGRRRCAAPPCPRP